MNRHLTLSVCLAALLWGCDSETTTVSGTNDETTTSLGVIYRPDGKPAAGARVMIYAPGDTQATPRIQGIVDDVGHVSLSGTLPAGSWNLMVRGSDNTALLQDSLPCNGSRLTILSDTLRHTGKLIGRVQVQPQDKPTIAWIQLLGAGRYVNLDDSGRFVIDSLPAGRYTLAALTRTVDYTPTFAPVRIVSDSSLDLGTVKLIYTGIPMVSGLALSWDSVGGTVRLAWDPVSTPGLLGYSVYRGTSNDPAQMKKMRLQPGTSWIDTVFDSAGGSVGKTYSSSSGKVVYRVVAATAQSMGPYCPAESTYVRSPWLVEQWNANWTAYRLPDTLLAAWLGLGAYAGTLDSLGSELAFLSKKDSSLVLWTSADGNQWSRKLTLAASSSPVFWKGALWWTSAGPKTIVYSDSSLLRMGSGNGLPLLKSCIVHRFDGLTDDSVLVPLSGDTVNRAALVPSRNLLALQEERKIVLMVPQYWPGAVWSSADGKSWNRDATGQVGWWYGAELTVHNNQDWQKEWIRWMASSNGTVVLDSYYSGYSSDGSRSVMWKDSSMSRPASFPPADAVQWSMPFVREATNFGSRFFYLTASAEVVWAPATTPNQWHRIASPSLGGHQAFPTALQAWRNQLLVSDGTTLWMAPIPSGF